MAVRTKKRRPDAARILDSAGRELARRGYAATSLRQLMAASGVSTTAFYSRFASKEAVLHALVRRLLDELDARAREELPRAKSLEDGFRRGVNVLASVLGPQRGLVRLLLGQAAGSADVNAALGERYEALAELLAAQIELLGRRSAEAHAIAWSLVGALHMQILRWAVFDQIDTKALVPALEAVAETHLPALRAQRKKSRSS